MDDTPKVIDFYCYEGRDRYGRSHSDMVAMNNYQLENSHDVIQWLFPLHEPSNFNEDAPLIDRNSVKILRANKTALDRMGAAFYRFVQFLGFDIRLPLLDGSGGGIVPGGNYIERIKNWRTPFNHNHLRITRVIRSYRLFGFDAEEFYDVVYGAAMDNGCASAKTRNFWDRALEEDVFETLR